jgi:ATP-dependent helicase/nuclease subunit B
LQHIKRNNQTLKGEALTPSSFVLTILEDLKPATFREPVSALSQENLPETYYAAFSEFCRRYQNSGNSYDLKTVLGIDADRLVETVSNNPKTITQESATNLFGNDIYMSATKFDTFNRCKFSFFCKYGLRLQKLQPADFDVLQRGTIVHYVLERIISTYKETIKDFSREKCDSLCDFYIDEYLNSVVGYNTIKNARHDFLISKISRSLKEVVFRIANEFAQSDFKPTHCELKIGGKDGLPLSFDYDNGKVIFNGSIDRVDEYNGYIRIVDYKTGSKSFKLPDALFGLNLQMLIYLYAVVRGQNLPDETAAGILYMPSKRDLNNEGMAMNGLLQADISLLKAMEKENRGEYVPSLSINKDGSISKTATSFIAPREFGMIFTHIENLMKKTANSIASGDIAVKPIDGREASACAYCDFKAVCNLGDEIPFKVPNLKNSEVFEIMEKGDNDGIQTD